MIRKTINQHIACGWNLYITGSDGEIDKIVKDEVVRTAENMTKEFDSYMVKFLGTYEGEDDEETGLFEGDKVFVYKGIDTDDEL